MDIHVEAWVLDELVMHFTNLRTLAEFYMSFSKYQFLIFKKNECEKCHIFSGNTLHAIG